MENFLNPSYLFLIYIKKTGGSFDLPL